MNVLHIVTWYSSYNASTMTEGIFHYEQVLDLSARCNVAIYFPFDKQYRKLFYSNEKGVLTFRHKFINNRFIKVFQLIIDYIIIQKHFKPDLIHAHVAGGAGRLGLLLNNIFNIPYIITEHSPNELSNQENPKEKHKLHLIYSKSKKNLCVSEFLKKQLTTTYKDLQFEVIYNGVKRPDSFISENVIYKKNNYINICIVAAFYDQYIKGYQFLLPAIKLIKEKGINIFLHICGGGQYFDFYKNEAENLDIQDNCFFYGQCDKEKVYNIISQSDFLISASLFESAGVSIEEALLLGKPVLVTNSGGADSLINTSCGLIVEKGSSKALANGIEQMISKYNTFERNVIKQYALESFEISNISNKYINIYSNLMRDHK